MKTTQTSRTYLFACATQDDHAAGIVCRVRDTRYSTTWALTRTAEDVDVIDPDANAELSEREIRQLLAAWDKDGSSAKVTIG